MEVIEIQQKKVSYNIDTETWRKMKALGELESAKTGDRITWTDIQIRLNEIAIPILEAEISDPFGKNITKSHEESVVLLFSKIVKLGIEAYKQESA